MVISILSLLMALRNNQCDRLRLLDTCRITVCITYCTLPGWPLGGPSVLCRPVRAAHTRCCRWCHRCRRQAGGTPHTPMHTHTAHSGHHRLPRKSSWHKLHLDGNKRRQRLSVCVIVCVCVFGCVLNRSDCSSALINTLNLDNMKSLLVCNHILMCNVLIK